MQVGPIDGGPGVLPAYAGMIPVPAAEAPERLRAPRVCGDDPCRIVTGIVFA